MLKENLCSRLNTPRVHYTCNDIHLPALVARPKKFRSRPCMAPFWWEPRTWGSPHILGKTAISWLLYHAYFLNTNNTMWWQLLYWCDVMLPIYLWSQILKEDVVGFGLSTFRHFGSLASPPLGVLHRPTWQVWQFCLMAARGDALSGCELLAILVSRFRRAQIHLFEVDLLHHHSCLHASSFSFSHCIVYFSHLGELYLILIFSLNPRNFNRFWCCLFPKRHP